MAAHGGPRQRATTDMTTRNEGRLRATGDGPRSVRLGRRVLYGEAGLAEWVAARTGAGRADERAPGEA